MFRFPNQQCLCLVTEKRGQEDELARKSGVKRRSYNAYAHFGFNSSSARKDIHNYKKADLRKMRGNHKNSMVSYGQRQGGRWMESRRRAQGTSKALLIFYFLSWVYEYLLLLFNTLHLCFFLKSHKLKICLPTF